MYSQLINKFKASIYNPPGEADLDLGLAIKQIRQRMGMTQAELAQIAGVKQAALKTLENGYAKFTTMANLESFATSLKIPLEEIVFEAREWYPGNFFVMRLTEPPEAHKKRRRKYREDIWFKQKPLVVQHSKITFMSPPLNEPSHFCFFLLEIDAGSSLRDLQLPCPNQITGFVQRGSLCLSCEDSGDHHLFGNQGFAFRGDKIHHFINQDNDNPLRLCLAFPFAPNISAPGSSKKNTPFSIGRAIRSIRYIYSNSPNTPLTFSEFSRLTGLDENALKYLEKTTEPKQVIYWNKIEKISQALKIPFSRILELASGKDRGYFYSATAHDRALIDYRHYLGVRIQSALFPSPKNNLQIAEMYIDPKGGIKRASWKRKDDARISAYVEDGELLVEVGKNRKTNLREGESVYFDGSLGYIFTNTGTKPAKLLLASCPPIVF